MKNSILLIAIPALIIFYSCHRGDGNVDSAVEESGEDTAQTGEIVITTEQFETSDMKIGSPSPIMFSNEISANGTLGPSLTGRAKINTLIPGRVKKISHSVGDPVDKGEVLFLLESHEIIQLQQDYAEVVQQLVHLNSNYERQKSLSDENIIAQKDFHRTESEYKTMLSRAEGLKVRLRMIHIDPAAVEKGTILSVLTVRSPIRGVVTRQELVLGQFLEPQVTVMEVVDTRTLQLTLRVFEKDLSGMVVGQTVKFYSPDQKERIYEATLSHIGKSIDLETKTVRCIAQLQVADRGTFVNNLFVESRIITCEREALAIPESALTREPERDFVWIRVKQENDQMTFRKIPVQTGVTIGANTEILDEGLSDVLLKGAYNLWSGD